MKEIWKTSRRVACVLAGLGIVLSLAGFALSGFDPRVFSAKVDRGTVSFGGTIVENPKTCRSFRRLPGWAASSTAFLLTKRYLRTLE